jgi:hypothetical protein
MTTILAFINSILRQIALGHLFILQMSPFKGTLRPICTFNWADWKNICSRILNNSGISPYQPNRYLTIRLLL